MKKYFRRLIWKTPTQRFTFFLQFGILHTLVMGIAFSCFAWVDAIGDLRLFEFTAEHLPNVPGSFWGILLILCVVGHVIEMIWRGRGYGTVVGMIGFLCWFYASIAYIYVAPISILMVTLWPMAFWIWYYFSSIDYKKELDLGLHELPD